MSLYVHGRTTNRPATEADLAQARHRNSQLAAELRQLDAIGERLQTAVDQKKARLEADRDEALAILNALKASKEHLTLETAALIAYRARMALLPTPVHGGRDGLLAATAELEAHTSGKSGKSHGTKGRYYEDECRCSACLNWYDSHRTRERDRYRTAHNTPGRQLRTVGAAA